MHKTRINRLKLTKYILSLLILIGIGQAGESQFGLVNNSLGNIQLPYSSSGLASSYEVAKSDSVQLNFRNFATWTNISRTTFSWNLGYNGYLGKNKTEKYYFDNANFAGVFLAIPLQPRKLILGVGLQPFTSVEQRLENKSKQIGEDISENIYINGGISKANINLVYKPIENYSFGIGYEFTFGKLTENVLFNIDDNLGSSVSLKSESQVAGNGIILSFFGTPVENFNFGIVVRPTVLGQITRSAESTSDFLNKERVLEMEIPAEYNLGLEYSFNPTYSLGMDLVWQDWKNGYKIDNKKVGNHELFYHLGFGLERKGSSRKFVKYIQQIDLRLGGFYNQLSTYNDLDRNKVNEVGITAGISLPIQRFKSKIDFAGFISKRGNLSKNFLEETIVGFSFSISANELWFVNLVD